MADKKELKKGLISVVMSNYNTPIKYLKESIDSVLNQTYSNFEFIIIDDGSTDDSLEFIKSYDDPRIKLIINEENIGLTKSLNKGLDAAQGEFIARMDTDDICYPERFEKQLEYMREHPDTIVCGTWAKRINENNETHEESWLCRSIDDMELYRIYLLFYNSPLIIHPSVFFNHKLLRKYNLRYNEKYRYSQDYNMWVDCSKYANCSIVGEFLLQFREHEKSVSQARRNEQKVCAYQIMQKQLDDLHLTMTDDLISCHACLLTEMKPYDKAIKVWIKRIIKANNKYRIYNQHKLKSTLWYRWSEICYDELSRLGFKKRIILIASLSLRCKLNLFKIRRNYRK